MHIIPRNVEDKLQKTSNTFIVAASIVAGMAVLLFLGACIALYFAKRRRLSEKQVLDDSSLEAAPTSREVIRDFMTKRSLGNRYPSWQQPLLYYVPSSTRPSNNSMAGGSSNSSLGSGNLYTRIPERVDGFTAMVHQRGSGCSLPSPLSREEFSYGDSSTDTVQPPPSPSPIPASNVANKRDSSSSSTGNRRNGSPGPGGNGSSRDSSPSKALIDVSHTPAQKRDPSPVSSLKTAEEAPSLYSLPSARYSMHEYTKLSPPPAALTALPPRPCPRSHLRPKPRLESEPVPLSRGDTRVVSQLLKARARRSTLNVEPTIISRTGSTVSRIERKGSIQSVPGFPDAFMPQNSPEPVMFVLSEGQEQSEGGRTPRQGSLAGPR